MGYMLLQHFPRLDFWTMAYLKLPLLLPLLNEGWIASSQWLVYKLVTGVSVGDAGLVIGFL